MDILLKPPQPLMGLFLLFEMAAKKHARTSGIDVTRADIQDVWINAKKVSDAIFTWFFLDPQHLEIHSCSYWEYFNPRIIITWHL